MSSSRKRVDRLERLANAAKCEQITIIRQIVSPGRLIDWATAWVRSPAFHGELRQQPNETSKAFKARVEGVAAQAASK